VGFFMSRAAAGEIFLILLGIGISVTPIPGEWKAAVWSLVCGTLAFWLFHPDRLERWLGNEHRPLAYFWSVVTAPLSFHVFAVLVFAPSPIEVFKSGIGLTLVDDKMFTIARDTPQLLSLGDCRTECVWIDVADWEIPTPPGRPSVSLLIGGMTDGSMGKSVPVPGAFYYFSIGMQLAEGTWCEALLNNFSIRINIDDERANHAKAWVGVFKVLPKNPGPEGSFSGGPVRCGSTGSPPDPAFSIRDEILSKPWNHPDFPRHLPNR
jgi:hypothetical protein